MLWKRLQLAIAWSSVILLLSFLPQKELDNKAMPYLDKVVHCFFYGIQSYLLLKAFLKQQQYKSLYAWGWKLSLASSFLFGISVEIIQGTVFVSRSTEALDVLANTIGSLLGLGYFFLIYRTLKK